MANLILTVIGDDRSGLVDALSEVVVEHGGNWDRSHLARLSGKFAGIVQISIPDDLVDGLVADLEPLTELIEVTVERAEQVVEPTRDRLFLRLVGHDRPGIIHEVAHTLAEIGVGIEELETSTRDAPMAGGTLFEATASLLLPETISSLQVIDALQRLSLELMVDIDVDEISPE